MEVRPGFRHTYRGSTAYFTGSCAYIAWHVVSAQARELGLVIGKGMSRRVEGRYTFLARSWPMWVPESRAWGGGALGVPPATRLSHPQPFRNTVIPGEVYFLNYPPPPTLRIVQTIPNLGLAKALPLGGGGAARFGLD